MCVHLTSVYIRGIIYIDGTVYTWYAYTMKLKIKNSETITIRISGEWYYEIQNRAIAKDLNINDYVKNALAKYMEYKENTNGTKPT